MQNIVFQYLTWHFFDTPKGILKGWQNYLKFNLNYWSAPLLLRTWFSPWRRYRSSYGRGFSFGRYFEAFTFNMTSRILGAVMRTFFIVFGLLTELLVFFIGLIVLFIWLFALLFLIGGFYYGFRLLL